MPPVGRGVERRLHTLRSGGTQVRNLMVPPVGVAHFCVALGPHVSGVFKKNK